MGGSGFVVCRDDEHASLKQLSKSSGVGAAPGSGATKALVTSGVAADMTEVIKTARFLAMHEATRPYAAAPTRDPRADEERPPRRRPVLDAHPVVAGVCLTYGEVAPAQVAVVVYTARSSAGGQHRRSLPDDGP